MNKKLVFTPEDEEILNSYRPLVKSISKVIGPNCEVVLHSMANLPNSCIAIENGHVTGRSEGSPIIPLVEDMLKDMTDDKNDSIGVYYTKTMDGKSLKSATSIIRNSEGELIGCLCINIDVSIPLYEFIQNFLPVVDDGLADALSEHVPNDVDELIYNTLEVIITNVNSYREISATDKNKLVVKELVKRGIFTIRGAVEIVAKQLGVSRYTIYNYIKEAGANL